MQSEFQTSGRFERPRVLEGKTLKLKAPQGTLYVTGNSLNGKLVEVFVTTRGDWKAGAEAMGRLISLYLQNGGDLAAIIATLRGIKDKEVLWSDGIQVLSVPDAVSKALELLTGSGTTRQKEVAKE